MRPALTAIPGLEKPAVVKPAKVEKPKPLNWDGFTDKVVAAGYRIWWDRGYNGKGECIAQFNHTFLTPQGVDARYGANYNYRTGSKDKGVAKRTVFQHAGEILAEIERRKTRVHFLMPLVRAIDEKCFPESGWRRSQIEIWLECIGFKYGMFDVKVGDNMEVQVQRHIDRSLCSVEELQGYIREIEATKREVEEIVRPFKEALIFAECEHEGPLTEFANAAGIGDVQGVADVEKRPERDP